MPLPRQLTSTSGLPVRPNGSTPDTYIGRSVLASDYRLSRHGPAAGVALRCVDDHERPAETAKKLELLVSGRSNLPIGNLSRVTHWSLCPVVK
jgi:hypothetical protein